MANLNSILLDLTSLYDEITSIVNQKNSCQRNLVLNRLKNGI